MSKSALKSRKKAQKLKNAIKKANRKKFLVILICSLVVLAAAAIIFLPGALKKSSGSSHGESEIFGQGRNIIELNANGTFSASLPHNVQKRGTYTKTVDGDLTFINFNVNGSIETGRIENNSLHLPIEWDDGHGHGIIFPRVGTPQKNDHGHNH